MDIKLKNIKNNKFIKIIIFLLAVALLTSCLSIFAYLNKHTNSSFEAIYEEDYLQSDSFRSTFTDLTYDLERLLKYYKNEEYIKNGGTIDNKMNDNTNDYCTYSWELNNKYSNFKDNFYRSRSIEYDSVSEEEIITLFEKKYTNEIQMYKNKYIDKELNNYYKSLKQINGIDGLYYHMSSGEYKHSNVTNSAKEFFKSQPVYLLFDDKGYDTLPQLEYIYTYHCLQSLSYYPQDVMYAALSNEFLNPIITKWNNDRNMLTTGFAIISILLLFFIICMFYLIYTAGKHGIDNKIHLLVIDKLYVDVNIVASMCIICPSFIFAFESFDELGYKFFIPLSVLLSIVAINLIISITKHIKNRTIFSHNLIYKLLSLIFLFIKRNLRSLINSFPIAFKMLPTPKKANDLRNIIKGVDYIKNGDLDYSIITKSKGIYGTLASDINNISDGLKAAVQNELKSERLKTELITNVSHDIRTPLTSIITYIDILKKEGLDSKDAQKYLDVLDLKALRLKTLTDDLFEVSRASSGNIPVDFDKVDITELLKQVMGELSKKIESSGLDFKFNYPKEKVFILGDGKLLWRVIENLMGNVFKYTLNNSRVYIDVLNLKNHASVVIKNISAYELNMDTNELMERFKRGDESRSSEGSGLGLSIAKNLVELQNGQFHIKIDGDLFKATVTIPKYKEL